MRDSELKPDGPSVFNAVQADEPVIEKGIPMPDCRQDGRPISKLGKIVRRMEPGDSILLDCVEMADKARFIARELEFKTARRKQENGFRMWRLE